MVATREVRPLMIGVLIFLSVLGLALIGLTPIVELPYPWETVSFHLGIAFFVAGFLGLTVELYTRREFTKALAKDVFKASIGHLLPDEFQDEMRWIYGQDAICEEHDQKVRIEDLGDGQVKYHCEIERHIRNISGKEIKISLGLGTDEWFASEPTQIIEFGYQIEGGKKVVLPKSELAIRKLEKGRPTTATKPQNIKLTKGKKLVVWMELFEIKPINSDHIVHFTYSTRNPKVSVQSPDTIGAVVAFYRETETNKSVYSAGTYRYEGLVPAGHEIRVRWWEKSKLDQWLIPN